jgi:Ulp1 family protease
MKVSAQQGLAPEKMGNVEDWTREELLEVPQQENGYDCGIFALLFARFAVRRRSPNFDQGHIQYYRRRICYDIVDPIINSTDNGKIGGQCSLMGDLH